MAKRLAAAGLAAFAISLAGCDLGPDYHKPALAIPPQFRATPQTEAAAWPGPGWWSGFRSPKLDRLEAQAQAQNFDIAAAIARVRRADTQVRITSAPLLPTLDATAAASYAQSSETDFLEHNLASRQAAVADAVYSRWDQQTVALTVVTDVAQTWFTALELADRLVVARQNLQICAADAGRHPGSAGRRDRDRAGPGPAGGVG
jgi:outer membrane protein, multidrug efflux system